MKKKKNWQKALPSLTLLIVSLAFLIMFLAKVVYAATCNSQVDGDWGTSATWDCGIIPGTDDTVNINNHVTSSADRAAYRVTLNGGGSGGTLDMGNNTLTLQFRLTNNNAIAGSTAFTSTGTVVFTGGSGIFGSRPVVLNNISVSNINIYFEQRPTINGEFQINNETFFPGAARPIYGSNSKLIYNTGNSYNRSLEWDATSGAGYPPNVQLSNNTTLVLGGNNGTSIARQITGTLTIDSGSNFTMDSPSPMTAALTILGDLINNGTLTLSSLAGGDLNVGGNWTNNNATFRPNGRNVTFNGSSAQSISSTSPITFANLTINNPSGVTVTTDIIVTGTLNLITGTLTTSANNRLIIAQGATVNVTNGKATLNGNLRIISGTLNTQDNFIFQGEEFESLIPDFHNNDGAIVFAGSSAQNISGTSPITFNNLTIDNPSGVTLNTDIIVEGTLNLITGTLTIGANHLIMGPNATLIGDVDIVGRVRHTDVLPGTNYRFQESNITMVFSNTGILPDEVDVTIVESAPISFTNAVQRTYNISQTGGSGFRLTLRLAYKDLELNGNDENTLTLWRKNEAGTWQNEGVDRRDAVNNYVEKYNVTGFSEWTISSPQPTAVDLANFSARNEGNHVKLEWATVSESDNLGFNLYRNTSEEMPEAANSLNSELIPAAAPGSGTGSLYEYDDHDVESSTTYYYWLADIDVEGNQKWHGPISISYENAPTAISISRFEHPTRSNLSWFLTLMGLGIVIGMISIRWQNQ